MDTLYIRVLRQWLPLAVAISAITFLIYLVIQQDIRMGANDPQIQIAEDLASSLNTGQTANISGKIDVAKSLAPFVIIYNKQEKIVSSNAVLNRKTPIIPSGVLTGTANQSDENRITWQPQEGVRLATVAVSYTNGFVVVGRNMREVEIREDQQLANILFGWIVALVASFSCVYVMQTFLKGKK